MLLARRGKPDGLLTVDAPPADHAHGPTLCVIHPQSLEEPAVPAFGNVARDYGQRGFGMRRVGVEVRTVTRWTWVVPASVKLSEVMRKEVALTVIVSR